MLSSGAPNGDGFSAAENAFLDTGIDSSAGFGGGDFGALLSGIPSSIGAPVASAFSSVGGVLSGLGGTFGKLLSSIGGIFGGFLATGGDVSPGKAYVVGERRPELFVPSQAGRIVPSVGGPARGGDGQQTHIEVHQHIYGVTDADSFQRSQNQLYGDALRAMTIAHSRTR